MTPTKSKYIIFKQICQLIPPNLVSVLAKKYNVDAQSRKFTPWSHVISMIFAQLAHSLSLNDVADTLSAHSSLSTIREAYPPSRNALSHANKIRDASMAEELFWKTLEHLQKISGTFGFGKKYSGIPRRFKKAIYAIDSTTIELVANCIDWAKHRRRKAAAKCHMNLNLQSFLPHFAIVKTAASHDVIEAKTLCKGLKQGEIAVFDKAYIDYKHLYELDQRGIFWVSRNKSNMNYDSVGQHSEPKGDIIKDIHIILKGEKSKEFYPKEMRYIDAVVLIDNKFCRMSFITNNMTWSPVSVCDLYKCRWGVEVFFKQIKQTLQLADFLGQSENAVKWQIWTALLTYVLLRYISYSSMWSGSFSRLFTLLRGTIWSRIDIVSLVHCYGTAQGPPRTVASTTQTYFPGLIYG